MMDEGPGFPFFLPKGMILKNTLIDYWREIHHKAGYQEISTPLILNQDLWQRSGHWDHYKNNMYTTVIDDTDFAVKPMNCPGGMLVYKTSPIPTGTCLCAWASWAWCTGMNCPARCTA